MGEEGVRVKVGRMSPQPCNHRLKSGASMGLEIAYILSAKGSTEFDYHF